MGNVHSITPPLHEGDKKGAERVFQDFLVVYQPVLTNIEGYLAKVVEEINPIYVGAYEPWLSGLRDLIRGAYLVAKRIPMPDPESFIDALHMFSFDSAIEFLKDICACCRINLAHDWGENFRKHIDMLLFSTAILYRQQTSPAR